MAETTKKVALPPEALECTLNGFLLGADPEFAIIDPPEGVIKNAPPNTVSTSLVCGDIGSDHSGRVWELRPAPSSSAYQVVVNMWKLLTSASLAQVEHFKWKGGALGGPHGQFKDTLGGHVHFGLSELTPPHRAALNRVTEGLLSLDILPSYENSLRQQYAIAAGNPPYGSLTSDVVRSVHSTYSAHSHVEYRAAPCWLDKPGQALMALTAYKLAVARPQSVTWPTSQNLKHELLLWLEGLGNTDVDAWLTHRLVAKQGFSSVQADPNSDFRPRWRRPDLWNPHL